VQEAAASGSALVQMPDVWVNLAHIYLAQGQFSLAIKMVSKLAYCFAAAVYTSFLLYQIIMKSSIPKKVMEILFTVPKLLAQVLLWDR
jgi:hypothetical protein